MLMKWNWNVVCIKGGIHQRKCSLASLFFAPMLLQMIPTSVHRIVCFVQNVFISRANMDVITWKQPRTTNLWKAAKAWTQKIEITFIGIRIWEENWEQLIGYFWYKEVTLVSILWHVRNYHFWEGEEVAFVPLIEVSRVWISALPVLKGAALSAGTIKNTFRIWRKSIMQMCYGKLLLPCQ